MLEELVNKIIKKQIEKKTIGQEEVGIYRYGYFLLLEVFLNIIIAFIIGILFKDLKTIIVFLAVYIPIRTYSGGWHANKLWKCTVISNLMIAGIELLVKYCTKALNNNVIYVSSFVVLFICIAYICVVSPVDTKAKPLNAREKKVYKNKLLKIIVFQICILLIFIFSKAKAKIFILEYGYLMQTIMLLMEKMKNKD